MNKLYHGSGFLNTTLRPGIQFSGKKVQWDVTESNEYLYVSSCSEEAIQQGFASILEKQYKVSNFQFEGSVITITFCKDVPSEKEITDTVVYLYTIANQDGVWEKVNNPHNKMQTEYKTTEVIEANDIISVDRIDLNEWLSDKVLDLRLEKAAFRW